MAAVASGSMECWGGGGGGWMDQYAQGSRPPGEVGMVVVVLLQYVWTGQPLEISTVVLLRSCLSVCLIDWLFNSCFGNRLLLSIVII